MIEQPEYTVVHEDEHLICVSKPAGLAVQSRSDTSLERYLGDEYGALHLVHRIDQPVSGVVMFAKSAEVAASLSRMFAEHLLRRSYWALVDSAIGGCGATIEHRLLRDRRRNKSVVTADQARGRPASLTYRVLARGERLALLSIELHTGRHHQVRAQLAAIGYPIRGDLKYGARRSLPDGGIDLHAREIAFAHPVTSRQMILVAEPPSRSPWPQMVGLVSG